MINAALIKTQIMRNNCESNTNFWQKFLKKFTTNQLSNVIIDGESALFHIYANLGMLSFNNLYENETLKSKTWFLKA